MGAVLPIPRAEDPRRGACSKLHARGSSLRGLAILGMLAYSAVTCRAGISSSLSPTSSGSVVELPATPIQSTDEQPWNLTLRYEPNGASAPAAETIPMLQVSGDQIARTGLTQLAPSAMDPQPLLIPLPSAVSTGIGGLLAIAFIGGKRRLRRKLLA